MVSMSACKYLELWNFQYDIGMAVLGKSLGILSFGGGYWNLIIPS